MVQYYINSILMGDRTVIDRAKDAPPDFITELGNNWKNMDSKARELAILVLERINNAQSAGFLIRATADPSMQVAAAAARVFLRQEQLPAGDSILNLIPSREAPFVRGKLYLAAGKSGCGLDALRRTASMEADAGAAALARVAMVRRGGASERQAFFDAVRKARPDEVRAFSEQLLFINDPNLAKAMVPWLNNTDGVMRLGFDGGKDRQARVCDFAIWTGKELGLPTGAGASITNYDATLISRVRKLYSELPDPKAEAL